MLNVLAGVRQERGGKEHLARHAGCILECRRDVMVYFALGIVFLLMGVVMLALGFAGAVVGAAGMANLALLIALILFAVSAFMPPHGHQVRRPRYLWPSSFPRWHGGWPGSHHRVT
jgi:uncharacterized membrane protein YtjA (UPF0391 family)